MTQHKLDAVGTRRALKFLIPIALIVFVADQLTKVWAESALTVGDAPQRFIGEFIQLRLIYNPGAALSFGTNATAVLTLVSFAVAVGLIWVAPRLTSVSWVVVAGLLLGGSTGNLADRLFRDPGFPVGHVVDFIDYGPFIGNVADIAIVVAAVLIGLYSILGKVPLAEKNAADSDGSGLDPVPDTADSSVAEQSPQKLTADGGKSIPAADVDDDASVLDLNSANNAEQEGR